MIRAIRKKLAIRGYRRKLGPYLEQRYGWQANYSPQQVRGGVSHLGLAVDPLCYAYAMYCTRADFDAHHAATGEACDYGAMREEIASIEPSGGVGASAGDTGGGWFSSGDSGDSGGSDGGGDGGGGD